LPKKCPCSAFIEFSSPNIAKPLHAGHMRSTFLGNFLSNINTKFGNQVKRINYLGDWGTQYGILAVGFKKYGNYEMLKQSPIRHLLEVYVKANADESLKKEALSYFFQMEAQNEETLKLWDLFKKLSIKELESIYKVTTYIKKRICNYFLFY
jgi:arginyl-tRNA synthetase